MKMIDPRTLIRPWYLAGFCVFLSILFLIQSIIIHLDRNDIRERYQDQIQIREKITADRILSENDRYLKITKFYSSIISVYGVKFHPKKKRGNDQGLNNYQRADFIRETYQLCRLLDIPWMLPMAIATFESAFRPYAETE